MWAHGARVQTVGRQRVYQSSCPRVFHKTTCIQLAEMNRLYSLNKEVSKQFKREGGGGVYNKTFEGSLALSWF